MILNNFYFFDLKLFFSVFLKSHLQGGHSKLVMTIKGVFGCIYGVFETFEGVGLG